jgi:hypothetical protein
MNYKFDDLKNIDPIDFYFQFVDKLRELDKHERKERLNSGDLDKEFEELLAASGIGRCSNYATAQLSS